MNEFRSRGYGGYGNRDRHSGGGGGGGGRFQRDNMTAPVSVGEELDVKIEAVGAKGDGIAKKNNFVIFVPGVKEGETLRVRITKVLRKVGFAEKIGEAQGPVETSPRPAPRQEETAQGETQEAEPEQAAGDSEDFGEESSEESSEE